MTHSHASTCSLHFVIKVFRRKQASDISEMGRTVAMSRLSCALPIPKAVLRVKAKCEAAERRKTREDKKRAAAEARKRKMAEKVSKATCKDQRNQV